VSSLDPAALINVLPEILLVVLALMVMGLDLLWPAGRKRDLGLVSAAGMIVVLIASFLWPGDGQPVWGGMIQADLLARLFRILFLVAGILTSLISMDMKGLKQEGEYYAMIIIATMGMGLMATANDFLMLYVAMEMTSITQYLLVGYMRREARSVEAGIKYFLFGAVTSTVMLFGLSFFYGFTGQTNYAGVRMGLFNPAIDTGAVLVALILIAVGFGFKIAAVPFHFWTPDTYEGAPTPVTAFISVASKAAGFAVLFRVLNVVFPVGVPQSEWTNLMETLAIVTMTLGNVLAIPQTNIKRLLAYSSIAQAGYVLIGVAAVSSLGVASALFYLAVYVITNIGAFAGVIAVANRLGSDDIRAFAGLSRRSPYLALMILVAFLSLGGVPPTAGFVGKLFLFQAAVGQGLIRLAVIGVLNVIVGLYYYLMVLKVMYVDRGEEEVEVPVSAPLAWTLAVSAAGVMLLGIFAHPWYNIALRAAAVLFPG